MSWQPHVTVATVVEHNGRFLLVEEHDASGERVYNQPAGHLEAGETLVEAAYRETLEETGYRVRIDGVVGIGLYTAPANGVTYHRTTFFGQVLEHLPQQPLDTGILCALWLEPEAIRASSGKLRSPLVWQVVRQYLDGHRYPLSMIYG